MSETATSMSLGPGSALREPATRGMQVARAAVVVGTTRLGEGSLLAEGAVIRSQNNAVDP